MARIGDEPVIHQICHNTGVTATEALQLVEDKPFWRTIAMVGGFAWTLCVKTMTMRLLKIMENCIC